MPSLSDRFISLNNRPRLVAALRQNRTVYENPFAEELETTKEINTMATEYKPGDKVTHSGIYRVIHDQNHV